MSVEDKGTPQYFLNAFLRNPATSIPKGAQWAILFEDLIGLLPAIENAYKLEPERWNTSKSADLVLMDKFQTTKGCLFCTAIDIPGEGGSPIAEGSIKSNNFIRSYVGAGRNDFPTMRMSFVDTNISFCESFLRGWSLATSAFGMIARSGEKNYRTKLTCYKFAITPTGPTITQIYTFYDICCINVGNEEYNYDTPSGMPRREANFVYNYYQLDLDKENTILEAQSGNLDRRERLTAAMTARREAGRAAQLAALKAKLAAAAAKEAQQAKLEADFAKNQKLREQIAKANKQDQDNVVARREAEIKAMEQLKKQVAAKARLNQNIANTSGLLAGGGTGGAGLA